MAHTPKTIERIVAGEVARAQAEAETPPPPFRDTRPEPTSDGARTMRDAGKRTATL